MGILFNTPKSSRNLTSGALQNDSNINLASVAETYTNNGTYTIPTPEGYDGISTASITVNVPSEVNNQEKSAVYSENGQYEIVPDANKSGLSKAKVTVNVQPKLQAKSTDELNAIITPDEGKDGLSKVVVAVPTQEGSKTITANGTYTIEPVGSFKALSKATVVVDIDDAPELEEKSITENGVYEPSEGKDGFSKVTVDVHQAELEEKSITENGTYVPSEGKDGFSKVVVDVPGDDYYIVGKMLVTECNGEDVLLPPTVPGYSHCYFDQVIVRTNVIPNNQQRAIQANGTYYPSEGYDGFGKIVVDVEGAPITQNREVQYTKPGDYILDPTSGFDSMNQVRVDIDIPKVTITEVSAQGVRGASYEVALNKITGGEFTSSDGKRFYIEW